MKIKLGYRGDSIEPLKRLLENYEVEFVLISKEGMELMDEFYFDYTDENLIPTDALAEHIAWLAYYDDEVLTFKPGFATHYITDFRNQCEEDSDVEYLNEDNAEDLSEKIMLELREEEIKEAIAQATEEMIEDLEEKSEEMSRQARYKWCGY